MTEKKHREVRDANEVIRDYYEQNTEGAFREDGTKPVSSVRPRDEATGRSSELSGGDVDAAGNQSDVGTETAGGSNPTPDQDSVDDVGKAAGVEYQDNEPLKFGDKVAERDERRWELDPASSEDYRARTGETEAGPPSQSDAPARPAGRARSTKPPTARAARARRSGSRRRSGRSG
jgi:hypothetical protein